MVINSDFYPDDDRIEIIGDKGILFVNRCTAKTIDLPEVMIFRDGKTTPIAVEQVGWQQSFINCTGHLIEVLKTGGNPILDGIDGKKVLQTALAVIKSSLEGIEVNPSDIRQ